MRNNQMPTTIRIDQHQSPTSSRSASRSGTISEEEFSSGTGEHIPSGSGSYDLSDPLDETWDYIPDDHEIEPSESASRPRTSRRPPPASRPTRRHTATERPARHPPVARVRHVHVAPPSSVEPDDYPGYGRGYPGQYGGRMPQPPPGYAPSAYSVAPGGAGPYAPPFGNPGALTHYGQQQGGYQYPGGNPFSPQPPPPGPGGAGYFNGGGHHAMSTHGTPSPYGGHEMMQYPPMPGYGAYSGYPPPPPAPPNMSPHMQFYPPQWSPPSDHSNVGPDPEVEKKLLAIEELMKNQKIDFEKAQKELAARDAADAAKIKAAEAAAAAAAAAAAEKAAWEKKLAEEKKAAAAQGAENAKKQIEAEKKKAEQAAADEKEKADAKAAVAKAEADSKAAIEKAEKERKEAIEKSEKEAKEAVAKAEKESKEAVEKAEKEAKEAVEKAEKEAKEAVEKAAKEAKESIDKALAPTADTRKPIKFKDAVGRKFSFPFHLCETWGGMEELIKQAFVHVDQFSQHVAEGHYDLIGPNGEIILPQVWDTMIEPDWNVTMMMWPIPEKPPAPGPPPFHGGRPSSRHHGGRGPPGPPPPHHRGAGPPPPPPGWGPGGPPRPPGPGGGGPGPGPGGPPIVVVPNGSGAPRVPRRKTEPAKGGGMLGWMAGKPAKPSGKGPKKAEPYNACLVM